MCRLRLGRLVVLGRVDCSGQSTMPMTISAQLRANRMIVLSMKRVGRLRLGRLLAFGMADCLRAIGHTSAQLGPAAAQSAHPCLERLLPLGLAYPGTNPSTVVLQHLQLLDPLLALKKDIIAKNHF